MTHLIRKYEQIDHITRVKLAIVRKMVVWHFRESLYREQRTNRDNYKAVLGQLNCGFVNNRAVTCINGILEIFLFVGL